MSAIEWTSARQWDLKSDEGDVFRIQVSWPVAWEGPKDVRAELNILYCVDGNAFFGAGTEIARRALLFPVLQNSGAVPIIVAIGYPNLKLPYSSRRNYDLTPPCHQSRPCHQPTTCQCRKDSSSSSSSSIAPFHTGGAAQFLRFISNHVRPFIRSLFPSGLITHSTLFGHSFGGLFALYALFTSASDSQAGFDAYIAISPSIWFGEASILPYLTSFLSSPATPVTPSLYLGYGSLEDHPERKPWESDEDWEERRRQGEMRKMGFWCEEVAAQLERSRRLGDRMRKKVWEGEDHGSVGFVGLQWGMLAILEEGMER